MGLADVQEQVKLSYADRIQKDAYLGGKAIGLERKGHEELSGTMNSVLHLKLHWWLYM